MIVLQRNFIGPKSFKELIFNVSKMFAGTVCMASMVLSPVEARGRLEECWLWSCLLARTGDLQPHCQVPVAVEESNRGSHEDSSHSQVLGGGGWINSIVQIDDPADMDVDKVADMEVDKVANM